MKKSGHNHRVVKKVAKGGGKKRFANYRRPPTVKRRRIHITPASSATEILQSLGISSSDVQAAIEVLDT